MKFVEFFFISPLLSLSIILPGDGTKIFFMIPLTSVSEKNIYIPLIDQLSQRGHGITVATVKKSTYQSKTIKEFVPLGENEEFLGVFSDPMAGRKGGIWTWVTLGPEFETIACHKVYENPEFKRLISKEEFDLIVINSIFQKCFVGILEKKQTPFIILSTFAPLSEVFELAGNVLPTSFVPNPMLGISAEMNFLDRVFNLLYDTYSFLYRSYYYGPACDQVAQKYLGKDIRSALEITRNVSLILSNSDFVINSHVPTLPDVIEVGGMHCRPANSLPKELEEFASGSKVGLIYFSLGTIAKSESLPVEKIRMFLSVFAKLNQRVLWKINITELTNVPANVKLSPWVPQQDVLGHPNTKLFISHGGLLSTQEAGYHGVPVIGLPIFADQEMNMRQAESKGYAKKLDIISLNEETLLATITEFLTDRRYSERAKEISTLLRDQPMTPLDRATFWVEYVIRHKGALHLRSAARNLSFIQYYSIDVIVFLSLLTVTVLYSSFNLLRYVLAYVFPANGKNLNLKKRQ